MSMLSNANAKQWQCYVTLMLSNTNATIRQASGKQREEKEFSAVYWFFFYSGCQSSPQKDYLWFQKFFSPCFYRYISKINVFQQCIFPQAFILQMCSYQSDTCFSTKWKCVVSLNRYLAFMYLSKQFYPKKDYSFFWTTVRINRIGFTRGTTTEVQRSQKS